MVAILRTVQDVRAWCADQKGNDHTVALVPTMGALHAGHMALVEAGLKSADRVIASIFVNPTQFGPNEDFTAYPRTWDADLQKLEEAGSHAVFSPAPEEIYPDGFVTAVSPGPLGDILEGAHRPGHFDGVATVVTKLLLQVLPDTALFGEKDYQQLLVIRRIVKDLNISVRIQGVSTVRDESGLALSSRNAYLDEGQYKVAVALNRILFHMAGQMKENADIASVCAEGQAALISAGFDAVDYLEICDAETLEPLQSTESKFRILVAARLGSVRLIDNVGI